MSDRIDAVDLTIESSYWVAPGAVLKIALGAGECRLGGHVATRNCKDYPYGYLEISARSAVVLPVGPGNYNLGFHLDHDRSLIVLPLTKDTCDAVEAAAEPDAAARIVLGFFKQTAGPSELTTVHGTPEELGALLEAIADIAGTWLQVTYSEAPIWGWDEWQTDANAIVEAVLRWYRPVQNHAKLSAGVKLMRQAMQKDFEPAENMTAHERFAAFAIVEAFLERAKGEEPKEMFEKARAAFDRLK